MEQDSHFTSTLIIIALYLLGEKIRVRSIIKPPTLALQLREHKQSQSALRLLNNKSVQPDDLIFSDFDGQPINPNTVTPAFNKMEWSEPLELDTLG